MPKHSHNLRIDAALLGFAATLLLAIPAQAQPMQFPSTGATQLRTQAPSTLGPPPTTFPSTGATQPAMVPVPNAPTYSPSTSPGFDAFSTNASPPPLLGAPVLGTPAPVQPYAAPVYPPSTAPGVYPSYPASPGAAYPGYSGPTPAIPGAGQSATVGTFQNGGSVYSQPGTYPNAPSALFPGTGYSQSGGLFGSMYEGLFGSSYNTLPPSPYAYPQAQYNAPGTYPQSTWNPQGTVFSGGQAGYPQFIRFFQGPRFRHGYIHGNDEADGLMINDSDLALAFAWPNFLYSTQPLYLMPSFSLHQWDGPHPDSAADLPAIAYSAFLDTGWQSDPGRILGAELGMRVGMFSDFETATSDSLRVMGRAIGRLRLTPRATVKLGVLYLDRNKIKLLPAGGVLWQPNPDTRFDLFFPEPKLAHYLSTIGTTDTWWYVGGYYGGGAWTVQRTNGDTDSVDINDLRLVLGFEWGRNEQMREGRRMGFLEIGYVFDRELRYRYAPEDSMDLQDTIMVRAGFGF